MLAQSTARAASSRTGNGDGCPEQLRVFVVEDSPALRDVILEQLGELPNVICSGHADNEASAISALRGVACDVLIVDIKLKTGSGIGVLHAIASDWPHPPATRIVFSNYTDPAFRTLAMCLGATHFFDKTSEFTKLLCLVAELAASAEESR